ncbi:helix-turn-helix domain-containing protein [Streptomyces hirsutus]|uniref:Helix-turn-helix domain-containing protein n=1 Tax=Streptomyces hirsutus TaxID=35620 RepID=A0ABZ1GSP2_9ACTN|nr:helix-turn-helix domain-containing protein [Streptomyces hirsutus]WSD08134.1 helix-turn-helix domain-containing protein [Streptomyces hirsutus]
MAEMKPNVAVLPSQGLRRAATPSGVTHVREYQSDRYSIVGNHLAQHRALSLTAIGLAVHILSLPEGSPADIRTLAERFPEGRDRIAFALRELEACGYLARVRERTADGWMITRTYAYNAPALTRERVHTAADSVAVSAAGSVAVAQVPASPASPVPPTALALVDGPAEEDRVAEPPAESPGAEGPLPVEPQSSVPRPAEPDVPEPDPSLSEHYGKAVDLLAGLRRTDRQLMLSLRDVRRLAPHVIAWFDNGVGRADVIHALTADLPTLVKHPAYFLAHRLRELLPPPLPALVESRATTTAQGDALSADCEGGCNRVFRVPWPGAWCRDCRAAALAAGRVPPAPPGTV